MQYIHYTLMHILHNTSLMQRISGTWISSINSRMLACIFTRFKSEGHVCPLIIICVYIHTYIYIVCLLRSSVIQVEVVLSDLVEGIWTYFSFKTKNNSRCPQRKHLRLSYSLNQYFNLLQEKQMARWSLPYAWRES